MAPSTWVVGRRLISAKIQLVSLLKAKKGLRDEIKSVVFYPSCQAKLFVVARPLVGWVALP